jgi:RNase H-fold protein (predicted Holliday junction resolvase)
VKGKDRRQLIDKMAAAVLLQAWIDGRPSTSSDSGL